MNSDQAGSAQVNSAVVPTPLITPAFVKEFTDIALVPTFTPIACDVGFVFGGNNPDLWSTAARGYRFTLYLNF